MVNLTYVGFFSCFSRKNRNFVLLSSNMAVSLPSKGSLIRFPDSKGDHPD